MNAIHMTTPIYSELLPKKTPVMNRGMTIKGKSVMDDDRPFTATDLICIYRAHPEVSKHVAQHVSAALLCHPQFPTLRDVIGIIHKELAAFKSEDDGSC